MSNLWAGGSRLVPGCAVHRYRERGGYVAFYALEGDDVVATTVWLDDICLYLLNRSAKLDSSEYLHSIVVNRPDIQWGDSSFGVTYRDIPMRGRNTLLVHLALSDTARCRPGGFYVNDGFVTCVEQVFRAYDEVSFGYRPDTDTVSVTFKGLRDSTFFTGEELTIFTLDLDTAEDPRSAHVRLPQRTPLQRAFSTSRCHAVFDVQGRRVVPAAAGRKWTPGVYLRIGSFERRAKLTVVE